MHCNGHYFRNIGEIPLSWKAITFVTSLCRNHFDCQSNTLSVREAYCFKNSPDYGSAGKDLGTLCAARYSSYSGGVSVSEKNALEVIGTRTCEGTLYGRFPSWDLKRWQQRI